MAALARADFIYDAERDEYRCPAGQALFGGATVERGLNCIGTGVRTASHAP